MRGLTFWLLITFLLTVETYYYYMLVMFFLVIYLRRTSGNAVIDLCEGFEKYFTRKLPNDALLKDLDLNMNGEIHAIFLKFFISIHMGIL